MTYFKYLHIMHNEKFIAPYINFIKINFQFDEHLFIINGGVSNDTYPVLDYDNIIILNYTKISSLKKLSNILSPYVEIAEKIILHSLFVPNIVNYLYFHKQCLYKCNWIIWGGDLYNIKGKNKNIKEKLFNFRKRQIVKKFGGIICYNKAEYKLARQWTGAKGTFFQSFFYLSNLYEEISLKQANHHSINILIGNSADPTNRHIDALRKLERFKDENIEIYLPLSYGNIEYAKEVTRHGQEIFGDKLIPITDLMTFKEYIEFLGKIDIAIFNHTRAQAMGNITTLLGLGRKVYIHKDIITWELLVEAGVKVYDVENIDIEPIDTATKNKNKQSVKVYFSRENLLRQWRNIFSNVGSKVI